jgi:hypothetical protein
LLNIASDRKNCEHFLGFQFSGSKFCRLFPELASASRDNSFGYWDRLFRKKDFGNNKGKNDRSLAKFPTRLK